MSKDLHFPHMFTPSKILSKTLSKTLSERSESKGAQSKGAQSKVLSERSVDPVEDPERAERVEGSGAEGS